MQQAAKHSDASDSCSTLDSGHAKAQRQVCRQLEQHLNPFVLQKRRSCLAEKPFPRRRRTTAMPMQVKKSGSPLRGSGHASLPGSTANLRADECDLMMLWRRTLGIEAALEAIPPSILF